MSENDYGYLELDNLENPNSVKSILKSFEAKNRSQQDDNYAGNRIPIAIIRKAPDWSVGLVDKNGRSDVFCSKREAEKAWERIVKAGTPAMLQRYIFKSPGMPNALLTEGDDIRSSKS